MSFPTATPIIPITDAAPALPPDMGNAIQDMLNRAQPRGNDFLSNTNFNDVKGGGSFRLLPEKTPITARITATESKVSSNGNNMWKLTLETTGPDGCAGVTLWDNIVHTLKAAWKLKALLTATLDANGNPLFLQDGRYTGDKDGRCFIGQEIVLQVEHEAYTKKDGTEGVRNTIAGGYRPVSRAPVAAPAQPAQTPLQPGVNW